ncbi:DUF2922 domain-containing protein [Clostridium sp. C2-6-12]|uniref:DUF2922 domain-containing protein n=1 Tax=Clostridium sp. C2-6-12 TaxID=2698832 RepID=UPI001369DB05|nr:DUF2922 domain-containing protein [Clostridium sp. C2-6-12]
MEYVLQMVFLTEKGAKSTLSIAGIKSSITEAQANALMDTIISKNIFLTTTGALTQKESAHLTERKITKYTVA